MTWENCDFGAAKTVVVKIPEQKMHPRRKRKRLLHRKQRENKKDIKKEKEKHKKKTAFEKENHTKLSSEFNILFFKQE